MKQSCVILLLLSFISLTVTVAEQNYDNGDGNDDYQMNATADDDYYGSGGDDGDDTYEDETVQEIQICADSPIMVTGLSIVCDSPGTYYYGSGQYRDQTQCQPGDKAKIQLGINITRNLGEYDDEDDEEEWEPLMTLTAIGGSDQMIVYKNTKLCYVGSLKADKSRFSSYSTACPDDGTYTLTTSFYWSSSSNNNNNNNNNDGDDDGQWFTPVVTVGFHTDPDSNRYDLGGANTKRCWGNSAVIEWATNHTSTTRGLVLSILSSFAVLLGTIGILGVFGWCLWRLQQQQSRHGNTLTSGAAPHFQDERVLDYEKKMSLMRDGGWA